jgi:hypothetical protein
MHTVVACLSTFVSTWIRTDSQSSLVGRTCSCLALGPWGNQIHECGNLKKHAYLHPLIFGSFYYLRLGLIVLPAFNYELVGSVSAFAHLWPWNR